MKKQLLLLSLLFFNILFGYSHLDNIHFENFSTEQGLSNSRINTITEDNHGFIWIGTRSGLNRFDGLEFTVFKSNPNDSTSINSDDISSLCNSKTGNLWVGTWEGGVNLYNTIENRFYQFPNDSLSGANTIKYLFEDDNQLLWIATFGGGVYSFDIKTKKFQHYSCKEEPSKFKYVSKIISYNGKIWLSGGFDGLAYIDQNEIVPVELSINGNPIENLAAITASKNALYLIETNGKIYHYNLEKKHLSHYYNTAKDGLSPLWNIEYDTKNGLWVTSQNGLALLSLTRHDVNIIFHEPDNPYSLPNNNVFCTYTDKRNITWIGTWDGGLSIYNPLNNKFKSIDFQKNIGESSAFTIIEIDKNNLWIGSPNGVINANKKSLKATKIDLNNEKINENPVRGLLKDEDQIILSSDIGIFKYDMLNDTISDTIRGIKIPQHIFRSVYKSKTGDYWFGTLHNGLFKLDTDSILTHFIEDNKQHELIGNIGVYAFYEDKHNNFWIGTRHGLKRYNTNTQQIEEVKTNSQTVNQSGIRCITPDNELLWLGTSKGLIKYNTTNESTFTYTKEQGLNDDVIYGIIKENETLWLSTNSGISSFNTEKNIFKNYDTHDGLLSNEFLLGSYLTNNKGEIFFGSNKGINYFNPKFLLDNPRTPTIYFTDFKIFNKSIVNNNKLTNGNDIKFLKSITLNQHEKSFSIDFVGVSYTNPKDNKYAYKLDGFDDDWIYTNYKKRTASYTNLDPGTYTFHIKAANSDGVWSGNITHLEITVTPAFWQTLWFKTSLIILGILIAYFLYKWRIKAIEEQNELLEEKVQLRTVELSEKNKVIAFRNEQLQDNLNYGQRIQFGLLPQFQSLKDRISEAGVLYLPKETVSGDFYWHMPLGENCDFIAVVDCTGHGVPGAFMSMIGIRTLNLIINQKNIHSPKEILSSLDQDIIRSLKQEETGNQDGMDISIIRIDHLANDKKRIKYAGAKSPLLILTDEENRLIKGTRKSIAGGRPEEKDFEEHTLMLKKNDSLFFFTDGIQDQANQKREKYSSRRLIELVQNKKSHQIDEIVNIIKTDLEDFMQETPQRDDITLLGLRL